MDDQESYTKEENLNISKLSDERQEVTTVDLSVEKEDEPAAEKGTEETNPNTLTEEYKITQSFANDEGLENSEDANHSEDDANYSEDDANHSEDDANHSEVILDQATTIFDNDTLIMVNIFF